MLELKGKSEMANAARMLTQSFKMVQHSTTTYIPAHWITESPGPCVPTEQIWLPLNRTDKRRLGNSVNILFSNDSEITNFALMLSQFAEEDESEVTSLLIRTEDGLRVLDESGALVEPSGAFLPNVLKPQLHSDPAAKQEVFDIIAGWLNSEEEAHSLLHHLSTALSPGWSAVKYMLLIGDGRNGKSVLLNMVTDLFGLHNVSNVTRQQMAERLPVVAELNGKLLNIVYDGEMTYIKDSSVEKTLIAGEPAVVRMLYENGNTLVKTNALFIEALNAEPKSRDKSGALQKRLSRFFFPNVYPIDKAFEKHMRSQEMLGAFLALLLDHFVMKHEVASKLRQTSAALALQVEQNLLNSPIHQFISHLITQDVRWAEKLLSGPTPVDPLVDSFMAWRISEGFSEFSTADVKRMFRENFLTDWKSTREAGKVIKKQRIIGSKPDTEALINQLKGDEDDEVADPAVVED